MLEKTLRLLDTLAPGVYVPPGEQCYDEAEILELGAALNKLLYSPSRLRSRLQELGVNLIPANFYSEIPTIQEVERSVATPPEYSDGFDQRIQSRILSELMPYSEEFDPPVTHATPDRFSWTGGQFSHSDAMAYYCFIRKLRPRTIIEIGSGWSTLVADAAIRANGSGRIICVEPYPQPFLSEIAGVDQLVQQPVQALSAEFFN